MEEKKKNQKQKINNQQTQPGLDEIEVFLLTLSYHW